MKEQRLYFITAVKNDSYIYKYILASNKKEAENDFKKRYPLYTIEEIKVISPSKKLIRLYDEILANKK